MTLAYPWYVFVLDISEFPSFQPAPNIASITRKQFLKPPLFPHLTPTSSDLLLFATSSLLSGTHKKQRIFKRVIFMAYRVGITPWLGLILAQLLVLVPFRKSTKGWEETMTRHFHWGNINRRR
ncbi:hypothetical protein BV22DRAFT_601465 [Leucogyrophana mollusca]|uniref:Uncharacterized protein n=1 Tax=Leucogyrophana mollusca TaxID=85980 RepID=A0ACB8BBP9_9AGAM|nr:hypothetical protein BV22DRAFT_601465 [Leucogyrophana mollusca]